MSTYWIYRANQLTQETAKPFLDNCSLTNASLPGGRILEAN